MEWLQKAVSGLRSVLTTRAVRGAEVLQGATCLMQLLNSSGKSFPTIQCGVAGFIVVTSIVNVVLFHWPLYRVAVASISVVDWHGVLGLLTLVMVQLVISITLLALAAFISIRVLKALCILFVLGNAIALYFIVQYGVIIDVTMSGNIVNTSFQEASEMAHPKMLLYLAFLGFLPAAVIARVQIKSSSRVRLVVFQLVSLVLGLAWCYANASTSLWIDKNAKQFGGLVLPWSYVVNPLRYYEQEAAAKREPELLPALTSTDPRRIVFVLVIGEAARAQNFSLYGYGRETNPLLARAGIIAFPGARSCATYTTASVRCMLSSRGAANDNAEPLPSYLHRFGIEVIWRTHNFGEPPLKVTSIEHADEIRKLCVGDCARIGFDEVLLQGLDRRLRNAPQGTKTLVVLHQAGSHGPQYFRKYPPEFERFKPTCRSVELQNCSKEELVNAYDNTILYTDYLLNGVIELLKALKGTASVMLYMSDHGESLGENGLYLHGIPTSIAPDVQTSVPLIVWMSDEFLQRRGASRPGLIATPRHSPDVVFHTVMGALGLTSKIYAPQQDLLRDLQPAVAIHVK